MKALRIISQREVKATDFKVGKKYAFIGHNGPSEIGYVELEIDKKKRLYRYYGIKTGTRELCHPTASSRFLEVEIWHT